MLELNKLYNMDCMDGMKLFPDKYFELAICDPPYGGAGKEFKDKCGRLNFRGKNSRWEKYKPEKISVCRTGGTWSNKYEDKSVITDWDIAPPSEYFDELFRVSKNQIIWGGNYFGLPPTRCFIVWRKLTISETFSMAMCEYAWTSFNDNAKFIELAPQGTVNEKRFHPTQKPIKLYNWLIGLYAKPGDKILDTHVGSASSLIACYNAGHDFIGFEIDENYYNQAIERLQKEMSQIKLF